MSSHRSAVFEALFAYKESEAREKWLTLIKEANVI